MDILESEKKLKEMPFSVPDGYFDNMQRQVMERIGAPAANPVLSARKSITYRILQAAAAAAMAAAVVMGGVSLSGNISDSRAEERMINESFFYTEMMPADTDILYDSDSYVYIAGEADMALLEKVRALFARRRPSVVLGLALGSGGAKGMAHLGALKAFAEEGLSFSVVTGTSIGSIVGALYAKGYSWADMTSVVDSVDRGEFAKNLRPFADLSPIEAFLEQYLEGDFSSLALPFACCATDGGSNECVVLREGKLARALTASSAIPPFFRGVDIGGRKYYDGAFSNAVPADVCREMGAEVVVGIDLSAYARADAEKGRVERWVGSVVGAITPVRTLEDAKTQIGYMEAKSRMEEIRKAIADVQKNKPRRRLK